MANPRIIAGSARGIRLQPVPGDTTRPVTDIVKGALFNILGADIIGASFLDLFGGTGSIGIEALSRGAAFTRFTDLNRAATNTIKQNLERTRLKDRGEVIQADAYAFLKRKPDQNFDYVYIAPPQYKEMWKRALQLLDENPGWLKEDSWVIVQINPKEYEQQELQNLEEFDQRKYGNTLLIFYEVKQ